MSWPTVTDLRKQSAVISVAAALLAAATSAALGQDLPHHFGDSATEAPHVLAAFWQQSGAVTKATVLGLAAMALCSWYVLATRIRGAALEKRHTATAHQRFWSAPSLYDGVQKLELGSAFRRVAEEALEAVAHREGKLTDRIDLDEWLRSSLERSVAAADHKRRGSFEVLGAIVATAPALGLAGGLWALCEPLLERVPAGFGNAEALGAAAGEALAVTALGLAVAVPAALGRRWLLRRNELVLFALRAFAMDMRAVLLSNDAAVGVSGSGRAGSIRRIERT